MKFFEKIKKVCKAYEASHKAELGGWPTDCCLDTCWKMLDILREEFPDKKFRMVRGSFKINNRSVGTFG